VLNDSHDDIDSAQGWEFAIGQGVTSWWKTELEAQWEKEPHESHEYTGFSWLNTFALTEPGQYFVDLGLFTELEFPDEHDEANEIEIGPMFQKQIGSTINNLNVIFVRDYGSKADYNTDFEYEYQTKWLSNKAVEFGVQAFGEFGDVDDTLSSNDQEHKVGPALFGSIDAGQNKIKYDAALLFGVTSASPDQTLRFTLEYEM
jgi:hypothetical protein